MISIPDVAADFADDVARAYVEVSAAELGVAVHRFATPFVITAYELTPTRVAVYFGRGTSAGALWHIEPAERAGFEVSLLLETDVQAARFGDANVVTFPSGGFYAWYIGAAGNTELQRFVAAGNGFHGTCGGAVYGVDLGLLDVDLDMEGGWPAAADLRGPILLASEIPAHPVLRTLGPTWDPLYWVGQSFIRVGSAVTTLARYQGPTPALEPYDPGISRAYGYAPNTTIIERFWGRPAAVAGTYGTGKAVLTGTHPELYADTRGFFVDTLAHLTARGPRVVDLTTAAPVPSIARRPPLGDLTPVADAADVAIELGELAALAAAARAQLLGLEDDNEAVTDAADGADTLHAIAHETVARVATHRQTLEELLRLRDREGESPAFYEGVIALYSDENETLHTVKLETAYPILGWSFASQRALAAARFAGIVAVKALGFRRAPRTRSA